MIKNLQGGHYWPHSTDEKMKGRLSVWCGVPPWVSGGSAWLTSHPFHCPVPPTLSLTSYTYQLRHLLFSLTIDSDALVGEESPYTLKQVLISSTLWMMSASCFWPEEPLWITRPTWVIWLKSLCLENKDVWQWKSPTCTIGGMVQEDLNKKRGSQCFLSGGLA